MKFLSCSFGSSLFHVMSYSDSKAVFKKRFLEIGLTDANYDAFNAEGLKHVGDFCICVQLCSRGSR